MGSVAECASHRSCFPNPLPLMNVQTPSSLGPSSAGHSTSSVNVSALGARSLSPSSYPGAGEVTDKSQRSVGPSPRTADATPPPHTQAHGVAQRLSASPLPRTLRLSTPGSGDSQPSVTTPRGPSSSSPLSPGGWGAGVGGGGGGARVSGGVGGSASTGTASPDAPPPSAWGLGRPGGLAGAGSVQSERVGVVREGSRWASGVGGASGANGPSSLSRPGGGSMHPGRAREGEGSVSPIGPSTRVPSSFLDGVVPPAVSAPPSGTLAAPFASTASTSTSAAALSSALLASAVTGSGSGSSGRASTGGGRASLGGAGSLLASGLGPRGGVGAKAAILALALAQQQQRLAAGGHLTAIPSATTFTSTSSSGPSSLNTRGGAYLCICPRG